MEKNSVVIVEEFCAKNKLSKPVYEFKISPKYGYECQVELLGYTAIGKGRSNRIAKRDVATNLLALLRSEPLDIDIDVKGLQPDQNPRLMKTLSPEEEEEQRFLRFKAYFELTDSDRSTQTPSVSIGERHNTFKNFPEEMKKKAFAIIEQTNDVHYKTDSAKAQALLNALKLKGEIMSAPTCVPMLMITLQCEMEVIFVATKDQIWSEIIKYFDLMLR